MDQDKFQKFLKETFEPKREYFRERARVNQQRYRWISWGLIVLPIISAMVIALDGFIDSPVLKALAALIAILVSGFAAVAQKFQYQERATKYNNFLVEMNDEWLAYESGDDDYAKTDDPERYFTNRIRAFIREAAKSLPDNTITE